MTFQPIKQGEEYFIERLCKCHCEHHAKRRDKCKIWYPLHRKTKAHERALNATFDYLKKFEPDIFRTGQIELEYAFYRIRRLENV